MVLCTVVLAVGFVIWLAARKRLTLTGRRMLLTMTVMAGLGLAAGASQEETLLDGRYLERNENGAGSYEAKLQVNAGELLEDYSLTVTVPETQLTKEEEKQLLEAAKREIDAEFPGDNKDSENIREAILIRDSYQDGKVAAEWEFDNYEVMDLQGNVMDEELPEEGTVVAASVNLSCGTSACRYEFSFRVLPKQLGQSELLLKEVEDYLQEQETEEGSRKLKLPDHVGEQTLAWSEKPEYLPEKILLLGTCVTVLLPLLENSRQKEAKKKRDRELAREYPELLGKLVLLMGAGMTLWAAWNKIAANYSKERKKNTIRPQIVYEEVLKTCYEVQGGVGEERAYERFGERCGGIRYRKLGNMLAQNLKKGTNGLVGLLEKEAEDAFEERKSMARKYGEEAGAKLMFPMLVMLGVIMVILLVPAISSFQI